MADEVGFVTMAGARATSAAPEIGVGMLGYAFMGKAHTNAYKKIPYMIYPPPAVPKLVAIAGRDEAAVKEAVLRYGYEGYYTDWRKMLADPRVQLFDNAGPNNLHAEPCIAAAEAGKHILCEKPMARSREEAQAMLNAVKKTGVKHMVSFNYRFVPAIRQAYELIKSGDLGDIYHFRAVYLQEWIADPKFPLVWRLDKKTAGSGALGDLGAVERGGIRDRELLEIIEARIDEHVERLGPHVRKGLGQALGRDRVHVEALGSHGARREGRVIAGLWQQKNPSVRTEGWSPARWLR